jgi:hypothetical protein
MKISAVSSSWVGLFWLKPDLSDFAMFYADKEVLDSDLTMGMDITPDNTHRGSWPFVKDRVGGGASFRSLPRGRVEYSAEDGFFVVKTGTWLTDSLKAMIIKKYNLQGKKVRFDKNSFWDSLA